MTLYRRHTTTTTTNSSNNSAATGAPIWKIESSIPAPSSSTTRTKPVHHKSSFGWVTSLSRDGSRIAIAEPSWKKGVGGVYVYDYNNDDTDDDDDDGNTHYWKPSVVVDAEVTNHPSGDDSSTQPAQQQQPTIIPTRSLSRPDSFGRHVHLSASGQYLIVKAASYTSIYEYMCQEYTNSEMLLDQFANTTTVDGPSHSIRKDEL